MTPQLSEIEIIVKVWPIFVGIIIAVAWLIRLEATAMNQKEKLESHIANSKKELDDYKTSVKENVREVWGNINTIKEQNTEILKSLSRLEGKLENRKGVFHENQV